MMGDGAAAIVVGPDDSGAGARVSGNFLARSVSAVHRASHSKPVALTNPSSKAGHSSSNTISRRCAITDQNSSITGPRLHARSGLMSKQWTT